MTELLEKLGIRDRNGVEAFIERLIAMLDEMDSDTDFEDDPLEPYLAGSFTDREDGEDMGIGDFDGLVEQGRASGWMAAI
ncbi:MAG: hypothetical protein AB7P20_26170 [Rhizobiaceae bacterium]